VATTVVRPDPDGMSRAVFADRSGRQTIVKAGGRVAGCRLDEVGRKMVHLRCAGGAVTVVLWEGLPSRAGGRADDSPAAVSPASYRVSLPRDDFQFALEDRQRLVSQVSLEPAVADRRLYGYRITWLREGGDFHRLGLRDGDVIVSLNGVQAGDPGTFMQAVNGLRGTTSFALGVERDGAQIEYSYLLD
jgi:type II secretion system protein C